MAVSRLPPKLRVVALVAILVFSTTAPAAAGVASSSGTSDGNIHRTLTLSLTPDRPGEIGASATFEIPSNVRSLETTLPQGATVTSTRGFSLKDGRTYRWDESTANPRIRFTVPANRSTTDARAPRMTETNTSPGHSIERESLQAHRAQSTGYAFVDTGPWAIVAVPQLSTGWQYTGSRPTLEKTVEVDGEGATGDEMAYLGPHRTVERTAHGQRFEFVIPAAAELTSNPDTILASLTHASDTLRVGARDEHVFFIAAPTTVTWQAAGIEFGGSDFWVRDDEQVATPRNVWLHEYVHTRQDYQHTPETKWTVEAGAEYYAALLTLQQERIGFPALQQHLDRGTRDSVATTILADQSTWTRSTPYWKGALVFGNIDRWIRRDSDQANSMQVVLSRMNDDPDEVTANELYTFIETAGTSETRTAARRYAETSDVPRVWSVSEHEDAFSDLPARISYETADIRVVGEYRNESLTPTTDITVGERVRATVTVSNTGGATGEYETTMYVNGTAVADSSGTIDATTTETVTLTHTFDEPGSYSLTVGGQTHTLIVRPPADPQVTELTVDATEEDGEWTAAITVTLDNPSHRLADGTVTVTVDGDPVERLDVRLAPGASTTRLVSTSIGPGDHTIAAGNVSTSLSIPTPRPTTTPVATPGIGIIGACIAILGGYVIAGRR